MRFITAEDIDARIGFPGLVDVLASAFAEGAEVPLRHHHEIAAPRPGDTDGMLLLMPAWTKRGAAKPYVGLKSVTVYPGNGALGLPAINGIYVLMSGKTGEVLALLDAKRLTTLRTAAASALAARYLARHDARHLLMIGAGAVAPELVRAHLSVRPSIREVTIWNRTRDAAERLAARLRPLGIAVTATADLAAALPRADIVSAATISPVPLIEGRLLKPGAHVDCVGAYRPDMRETDDETVKRAVIFVDTLMGGLKEAGDVVEPMARGVISRDSIKGELADLVAGRVAGRQDESAVTMFKSVGTAIEDLAAAVAVYEASL